MRNLATIVPVDPRRGAETSKTVRTVGLFRKAGELIRTQISKHSSGFGVSDG